MFKGNGRMDCRLSPHSHQKQQRNGRQVKSWASLDPHESAGTSSISLYLEEEIEQHIVVIPDYNDIESVVTSFVHLYVCMYVCV